MTQPRAEPTLIWNDGMATVPREAWDALAEPCPFPFLEWDWLALTEESNSASALAGWLPRHLLAWRGERLVAAAPFYIKAHSGGEFVFDHVWAEVASRLGLPYYPKLVGMAPFTPASGYDILLAPGEDRAEMVFRFAREALQLCWGLGLSGVNVNFAAPRLAVELGGLGFSAWEHQGYVWENPGYTGYGDFLATLRRGPARNIRRERDSLRAAGVGVEMLVGDEITPRLMRHMYQLYVRTNAKFGPWGCKFLTREFFEQVLDRAGRRLALAVARRAGSSDPLAMALFTRKGERLWGRYWGAFEEVRNLHFEVCYHTPMEWAIAQGIRWFDPGMGGLHKALRGFRSIANESLHRFIDPRLDGLLKAHIGEINALERAHISDMNSRLPYAPTS
ncbi:protein of unknown function DUF482 [Alkalidesulfovibrio alkalitolerans DSM 16529]|jgi:predicted N-acyltransferase|uniref:BioF2-like acetyltransferase domain-containing protein n=1 Tax=Alkalidesulfovibrio alkalitolerans DSM 16529 TaxID=1121439 RepID=S7TFB9_9BACT|nr:GNAT family N-acetyltransferase [Alkalidesulfovibrio alkalitolerans]EPR35436.1 protein of unknown function DUF482 [Alkalidesulfovibrio alkalitolerans DSM 16529]